jgi:peptidoglycan/xylan/chitin deacetylase (PgdA/CDA1 family)
MAKRAKSRKTGSRRRSRRPFLKVFGFLVIVAAFAGMVFLATCQSNPGNKSSSYVPHTEVRKHANAQNHTIKQPAVHPAQTQTTTEPRESANAVKPADESVRKEALNRPTFRGPHGEVSRGDAGSSSIALTFDAGADSKPVPKILETLARHGLHATFFLTGKWMERNPELTKRISAEGHEIGNHSYSHTPFTRLSDAEIADEVDRTERIAVDLTGKSTKPYFRAPMGNRNEHVLSVLSDLGYRSIYWDIDCWDAVKKGITTAQIETRVTERIRNGSIVLMHCGSQATADTLESLINKLESAGYHPVKVSDLQGI